MLGLGPAAAQLSLGFQHLPALGNLGAALGSERPFHAAPLTHKCSTKRTPWKGLFCSACGGNVPFEAFPSGSPANSPGNGEGDPGSSGKSA